MPTIVCTVLRPESKRAVALAGDLADRLSLPLTLIDVRPVHAAGVADPMISPHAPYLAPGERGADPTAAAATPSPPAADLEALAHEAGVSPAVCERMEAPAAAAIEDLSAQPDVELIVASDPGGGPLIAAVTGEPPRSALRDLQAPLVLVQEHGRRPARITERPIIACAVLDDESAVSAAAVAGDLAQRLDAVLTFVHAGDDDAALDRIEDRVRSALSADDEATFEVLPREYAQDLHAWAAATGADLLVTGPPRHGAFVSALLGSVVHTAAQHGEVPVVIAPRVHAVD